MILENPSAFAAFKNIRSLLPSVQHKMTHHTLIKLLLDQGRDFNRGQDIQFENTLMTLEKIFRQKQIPFETIYRTDKPAALAAATDVWHFEFPNGTQIDWIPDRAFSLWCVQALLGHTVRLDISDRPLSPLERQILNPFYNQLIQQFPQTDHQSPCQASQVVQQSSAVPSFFAFKTTHEILTVRVVVSTAQNNAETADWENRLLKHVSALALPVQGTLTQNMALSDFLNLKKGDVLTFSQEKTPVFLKTNGYILSKGRLKKLNSKTEIQIEMEAL